MKIGILLNPNSRKNRRQSAEAAQRLGQLKRRVGELGHVVETQSTDELRHAIEALVDDGVEYLVSDGGDGALHWALNEVRRLRGDAGLIPIVPTCGGTIDFVARKVGVEGSQDAIVERLIQHIERGEAPRVLHLDSLRLTGEDERGEPFDRLGFALAAGGVGQRFFDHYYSSPDPSPATIVAIVLRTVASFALGALNVPRTETLQSYAEQLFRPTLAEVSIDGEALGTTKHGAIHAGAFDVSLGGVFRVFPLAAEPGQLHFQAGAITPLEIIAALPDLVRGGAIRSPNLREVAGTELRVRALSDELLAPIIDGEQFTGLRSLNVTPGPQVPIATV
ncbi:MAG: diacylglycerol kinase family protein [Polyangiaceae bacterium]